jgi:dTDP-glucose 4,6-dehydratase
MRIVVTGGAGFIGSAVIRRLIAATDHHVLNLDKLTYAASLAALAAVETSPRYAFRPVDICDAEAVSVAFADFRPNAVLHLAAETHVDRSIDAPEAFVATNTVGTLRMLEAARAYRDLAVPDLADAFRFHHVSTDEVCGALGPGDAPFAETAPYDPRSPYSASKAAADHLVRAWGHTYGLPVIVSNASNNYGPYQFPEKLVPLMIVKAILGEPLPVYGDGSNIRDWLHVGDHAAALIAVLERGAIGETYFVGGGAERTNLDVVEAVAALVDAIAGPLPSGASRAGLIAFVPDRPGHDFRYALDASKIARELGWRPSRTFEEGLRDTVRWFVENPGWWRPLGRLYSGERLGLGRRAGRDGH